MKLSAIQRFTMLDYPDRVACIAFTPGCNLRCAFCHNPEFVLPEKVRELSGSFISEEAFFNFLQQRQGRLEGVVVSGGEPTIWADLPSFLARIKALGFLVKLDTNGNNPAMLSALLRHRLVDYIAMDVKTTLKQYRALVGPGVMPERIIVSMALIRDSGIKYEFRTTLIKEHHTAEVLAEMKRLLAGANQLFFQAFRPGHTLSPAYARYHAYTLGEMNAIADEFRGEVAMVGVRT